MTRLTNYRKDFESAVSNLIFQSDTCEMAGSTHDLDEARAKE